MTRLLGERRFGRNQMNDAFLFGKAKNAAQTESIRISYGQAAFCFKMLG